MEMKCFRRLCFLLSLALGIKAAATAPASGTNAVLKSEFLYETAPFPSCHASTIVETGSGLVAAWFGGTAERNPDVCIYVSRQDNGRWSPPVAVADGVGFATNRLPTWNPVLFQPRTGPLLLFYKVGPSPAEWWGMMMTSDDAGKTWSKPVRLPEGILGPIKNKPVQLANGDILSPTSLEGKGGWRVYFERSTDGGKTWKATPFVNDGKTIGAIQPSLLIHPDGKLQSVGRTKDGKLFEVWSGDGGITWGTMTLTGIPNPNSGTDAVTLRDGRQLLVYNHNIRTGSNNKGRSPLNVAVSNDGKTWQAALVLEDDPDAPSGFAYPAAIQTADGLVHITYTWKRERIRHVVVDPALLTLRPMTNGEWPK
jgi:predicted neuraminidase